MFILKRPIVLVVLFFVLYVLISPNSNAISNSVPSTLHNKSELDTTQLYNLSNFYKSAEWHTDIHNKVNKNQLLATDLIFGDIHQSSLMTNALKVEFQNSALASQFKDKKVDIYGISFANNCIGLVGDKTSCMYGGITIHDNNQLEGEKNIGINVFKDGSKHETFTIATKKKMVMLQELDIKTRNKLEQSFNIYNKDKGDIKKGYINYHPHNQNDNNYYYDLYDFKGKLSEQFFRFYNDNIIVPSSAYHIDVYLFSN
ncbi:TPA: exotoxin [Staphylococcus aureus]|nr:exotoxin [Staphylococcus aureus]HCU8142962.1 exotoxin [Staphylococcus aureus]